jgi:uncharacterized protein (TIGR02246 family)
MPEATVDKEAIRNILHEQATAWNRGDAEAYARHFAAEGTFTNILGMFFTGQQAFRERHDHLLKKVLPGTVLHQEVVSLQFIHPGTAVVETLSRVSGCPGAGALPGVHIDAAGRLHTRLLQVLVKDADDWKIVAYHNVDVKAGVPTR